MDMRPIRPFLILLLLLISASAGAFQATPVRIADAKCAKCHQQIFQRYLSTPMAHASGAAGENLIPGTFLHAASGVEYTVDVRDEVSDKFGASGDASYDLSVYGPNGFLRRFAGTFPAPGSGLSAQSAAP